MHSFKKLVIGLSLLSLLLIPTTIQQATAQNNQIRVEESQGAITITTEKLTLKVIGGQPHFVWWNGNQSTADEMYKVHFTSIYEFFGADAVLDSKAELGGISYNLNTNDWDYQIVEEATEVTVTLTLAGLANNSEIQFIVHIYTADQPLEGTDQVVDALSEVKFDIIVNNWLFTEGAKGLALKSLVLESQKRHRVRVRNGTSEEHGNKTRTMQFESEEYGNKKVAYFEWTTFADVYNDTEQISTIAVGTAFFNEGDMGYGPPNDDPGTTHFWLTYPNYGDSYIMIHDPSVGIYEEAFSVPLYLFPVLGALIATGLFVLIAKKRK